MAHRLDRARSLATAGCLVLAGGLLGACGSGTTTPADVTPDPQTASTVDGRFEVRFTVDRATLRTGDDISGTAELWLRAGGSGALSGSGEIFGFEFAEVGGEHRGIAPVWTTECVPHQVGLDQPLTSPIYKSGVATGTGFAETFLQGREIHLPAGAWDITAIAQFVDGRSCSGLPHTTRATVRVQVNG